MTETKATVLTLNDLTGRGVSVAPRAFEVPELRGPDGSPGVVYLRMLSAADLADFTDSPDDAAGQREATYKLMAKALVTPDGERIVPAGEEASLAAMPAGAFVRISNEITRPVREAAGEREGNG